MTDREAMKMALDVLERASDAGYSIECEDAIEALRQALAQPKQDDEAYGYAKYLAECIWEKHYKEESPHWRPFDNTLSVLTQIDNMTCGLEKAQPEQERMIEFKDGTMSYIDKFWVGLTDDEAVAIARETLNKARIAVVLATDKKLKEKNT